MTTRRWALVTGASSGIGRALAERLAARGMGVLAVARRADRLATLEGEIVPVVADLSTREGIAATLAAVARLPDGLELLVNNAGFGISGSYLEVPIERELECIRLNVTTVAELTRRVLPDMVARGRGGVINVASTIAFQPVPWLATYAATKAFVLHYTEALAVELRGTGVRALALCPGPVTTEFEAIAGNTKFQQSIPNLTPERVADDALAAWDRGRVVKIVGVVNRILMFMNRFMPRAVLRRLMGSLARPAHAAIPSQLETLQ
jgi:short-subunit dehydrogenase